MRPEGRCERKGEKENLAVQLASFQSMELAIYLLAEIRDPFTDPCVAVG
jgi:hypothetical protein